MRKLALASCLLALIFMGCKKSDTPSQDLSDSQSAISKRTCGSYEVLQEQLKTDPGLQQRMDQIEAFTKKFIASERYRQTNSTVTIPVIVHVVYNTPSQMINAQQIQSQIDVLNEDYNDQNADRTSLPKNSFQNVESGGFNVHFTLAQAKYVKTKTKSFSTNDAVKYTKRGGDDVIDPQHNLNIWVCNLGQNLLGYAQFLGGAWPTDGVVILYSAFGSKAKYSGGTYIPTYDLGRTATHEIGHWMNLRHIWGDDGGSCSGTDYVDDTPNQASENYGCPTWPHISCNNNGDMSMNYMDYTDDACMYIFSQGQTARSLAVFASGGPRAVLAGN